MRPDAAEIEEGAAILLAARRRLGPIGHRGTLHDRASYRYFWQLLNRAHHTGAGILTTHARRFSTEREIRKWHPHPGRAFPHRPGRTTALVISAINQTTRAPAKACRLSAPSTCRAARRRRGIAGPAGPGISAGRRAHRRAAGITDVRDLPLPVDVDTEASAPPAFNVVAHGQVADQVRRRSHAISGPSAPSAAAIAPTRKSSLKKRWSTASRLPWTRTDPPSASWRAPTPRSRGAGARHRTGGGLRRGGADMIFPRP